MSANLKEILSLADEYLHELPLSPPQLIPPSGAALAGWIDHTLLKPDATATQIRKLCEEAQLFHFATVCVNPAYVSLCSELLSGLDVAVCSVVGFPLGASLSKIKVEETLGAISMGAKEIDTVINIGAIKSGEFALALDDVKAVVDAAGGKAQVKVILEMCFLDQREKIIGCLICKQAGANFVKTSTGFGAWGATVEDVSLMRCLVGADMGVKAAGGIRTLADALRMISAGANRLGASAGVTILNEVGVV